MVLQNYNLLFNSYLFFCKLDKKWVFFLKNLRSSSLTASFKQVASKKELGTISFLTLFIIAGNLPQKISTKKNVSFFRNRGEIFWGYKSKVGGKKFFEFYNIFNKNFLERSIRLELLKVKLSSMSKRARGISEISFIEEFSEINFFQLKRKFGFNVVFKTKYKNYINIYG